MRVATEVFRPRAIPGGPDIGLQTVRPTKVRVVLADDSEVMLGAIGRLLGDSAEVDLVGRTADFGEALRFTSELQPDVIVMDLRMAEKAHANARKLRSLNATLCIVAVTAATVDEGTAELAAKLEADKLLDKMQLYDELVPTILELMSNKPFCRVTRMLDTAGR